MYISQKIVFFTPRSLAVSMWLLAVCPTSGGASSEAEPAGNASSEGGPSSSEGGRLGSSRGVTNPG